MSEISCASKLLILANAAAQCDEVERTRDIGTQTTIESGTSDMICPHLMSHDYASCSQQNICLT
jgi:hypothetical protein